MWPGRRRARRTASARLLVAMQSLHQENRLYTSAVHEFAGGGSISVLQMRDLADSKEMGLRGTLVVVDDPFTLCLIEGGWLLRIPS